MDKMTNTHPMVTMHVPACEVCGNHGDDVAPTEYRGTVYMTCSSEECASAIDGL